MYVTTSQAAKVMGLGCACNGKCKGMGSIDLSSFTTQDWLLVGLGAVALFASGVFTDSGKRRRTKKAVTGFGGGAVTALILLGGGYLAYQYYAGQSA